MASTHSTRTKIGYCWTLLAVGELRSTCDRTEGVCVCVDALPGRSRYSAIIELRLNNHVWYGFESLIPQSYYVSTVWVSWFTPGAACGIDVRAICCGRLVTTSVGFDMIFHSPGSHAHQRSIDATATMIPRENICINIHHI